MWCRYRFDPAPSHTSYSIENPLNFRRGECELGWQSDLLQLFKVGGAEPVRKARGVARHWSR